MKPDDAIQGVVIIVLVLLIDRCHALKLPAILYGYVVAQLLFSAMCLVVQRQKGHGSSMYAAAFYLSMLILCLAVMAVMAHFSRPLGAKLAVGTFGAATILSSWVCYLAITSLKQRGMLTPVSALHIASSGVLVSAALIGLGCLFFPVSRMNDVMLLALTAFFGIWGIDGLLKADLYLRARASAVERVRMSPSVALIIVFGVLSIFLFHQSELSRQPLPEVQQVEAQR